MHRKAFQRTCFFQKWGYTYLWDQNGHQKEVPKMKEKAAKITKTYEDLHEEAKHSLSGLEKLIEKNSMSLEEVVGTQDHRGDDKR